MFFAHIRSRGAALVVIASLAAGCGGGGKSAVPTPIVTATASPTPTPVPTSTGTTGNTAAYTCATSDSASVAKVGSAAGEAKRRGVARTSAKKTTNTGMLAVTYSGRLDANARASARKVEGAARATLLRDITFSGTGRYERILRVTPGTETTSLAALRAQPNVIAASITGRTRSLQTVAQRYFSNDPYYNGFTAAQITGAGDTGAATYQVAPFEESATVRGQWGMHAIRLDYAQAYSQSSNGSGVVNGGALGSSNVKIAIVDSGEDSTHPELGSKIAYQKCFLTGDAGQSISSFSTDEDGHGTDVSGIAAAATNNDLGFVGSGGLASIYAYRIFPTPDDTCVPGYSGTPDDVCGASSIDVATAILDAVAQNVNVISLSLGGDGCTNGVDEDSTEQNAIASALAANIVVVAAAGNDNTGAAGLSAPACITGVIAVGATGLSDGVATGTTTAPAGTSANPVEYVAGYSQFGAPAASAGSAAAWGIVAPGGDPSSTDDNPNAPTTDDLHWIENIWTTTPVDSAYAGSCTPDFAAGTSGTDDCRTLIAGTSQATPVVAGAAALIIAANASYQSPAKMKTLLCTTAHDLGDAHEGCGRLDLYRAMATAVGDSSLPASQ
jgi:subtilisin family serine protease